MGKIPLWLKKKNYRSYIFGDFDKDGIPNADDKRPFDPKVAVPQQEVMLTDELRKIRKNNLGYKKSVDAAQNVWGGSYRIKGTHSTIGKLRRLFLGNGLDDIASLTVTAKNHKQVEDKVRKIKSYYGSKVKKHNDYYANPLGGYYMAHHLKVDIDGRLVELQVKTEAEKRFHQSTHDLYKTYKKPTISQQNKMKKKAYSLLGDMI